MSSSEIVLNVESITKAFPIYAKPSDRLKEALLNRIYRLLDRAPIALHQTFLALNDVSFQVRRGETVGIIGRNGAGKSTLLQIICGTATPTSGSVSLAGRVAALLELGAGFNLEFTGRENVYLSASLYGLTEAQIDSRFGSICEFAEIGDFIDQPVKTYSSGMFVRLAFAVIAHVDADILIVDEALSVGDAYFNQKCMRYLREFMKRGTLLFVSHDAGAVVNLCSKAVWLDGGAISLTGPAKDVCDAYFRSVYERQQGASRVPIRLDESSGGSAAEEDARSTDTDVRLEKLKPAELEFRVFKFSETASTSFGAGGARIVNVELRSPNGRDRVVRGGDICEVVVTAEILELLDAPIIGFVVRDRLGQSLFGENTFVSYAGSPVRAAPGEVLRAIFEFRMPIMPPGEYSVCAAIANGTQVHHVQHHWINDALVFRSISDSVSTGLVGIPMRRIDLAIKRDEAKL